MASPITNDRSRVAKVARRGRRGPRKTALGKPHGIVAPRVRTVGAERFAFVCIDPAQKRSEWMMADFLGNILIEPRTVEHARGHFAAAVALVHQAVRRHAIRDLIVTVERTGQYHLPVQRAFARAGFETRVVHPFAVKQYRRPADPGNKTDHTDLAAQHRAAAAGFGLIEHPLDETHRHLRLLIRCRRDLVRKASALCCQIREHLQLALPGYAACFGDDLWDSGVALPVARLAGTPQGVLDRGLAGLAAELRRQSIRYQTRSLAKILAWAAQAPEPDPDAALHQRIWQALDDDRLSKRRLIHEFEWDIAACLVRTPYVLLLAIPGLHVVSAGDLAGEMGPIAHYLNANRITGRAGLFPSRYQSDRTDRADGPLIRAGNRRLRAALMRIADNLIHTNRHFRGRAELGRLQGRDPREIHVRAAKNFSRLAFAIVAGRQVLQHPCCQHPDSILAKLIAFAREHHTPAEGLLADLQAAAEWLPRNARTHEARALQTQLEAAARRRRGPTALAELLPAVLTRLTTQAASKTRTTSGDAVPD